MGRLKCFLYTYTYSVYMYMLKLHFLLAGNLIGIVLDKHQLTGAAAATAAPWLSTELMQRHFPPGISRDSTFKACLHSPAELGSIMVAMPLATLKGMQHMHLSRMPLSPFTQLPTLAATHCFIGHIKLYLITAACCEPRAASWP